MWHPYLKVFIRKLKAPRAELTSCMAEHWSIGAWLAPAMMLASKTRADQWVSPVPRLVHPQLLPTPLSCCHVAMVTWEGPTSTTPGSQRRSLIWGEECCALLWVCLCRGFSLVWKGLNEQLFIDSPAFLLIWSKKDLDGYVILINAMLLALQRFQTLVYSSTPSQLSSQTDVCPVPPDLQRKLCPLKDSAPLQQVPVTFSSPATPECTTL